MKMKKMIGAVAVAAALAMGTAMPAFAAQVSTDNDEFSDSGSTEIKAKVDTVDPNVRATVPLQVTVVFGAQGEQKMIGPSADKYAITNIGDGNIKVLEAEVTDVNSMFTCDSFQAGDGADLTDPTLMFLYETAGNATYLTTDHPLSAAKSTSTDRNVVQSWDMTTAKAFTAETIASGDSLEISLGGAVYLPTKISQDDVTDTLCKIKYTIAGA